MYYPYFRGKQFDLIAIRDTAETLAASGFIPIIEPVRNNLRGLERALRAVCEAGGEAIVIVNPRHGDLAEDGEPISNLLAELLEEIDGVSAGVFLHNEMSVEDAMAIFNAHDDHTPCFVHAGFQHAAQLRANSALTCQQQDTSCLSAIVGKSTKITFLRHSVFCFAMVSSVGRTLTIPLSRNILSCTSPTKAWECKGSAIFL